MHFFLEYKFLNAKSNWLAEFSEMEGLSFSEMTFGTGKRQLLAKSNLFALFHFGTSKVFLNYFKAIIIRFVFSHSVMHI